MSAAWSATAMPSSWRKSSPASNARLCAHGLGKRDRRRHRPGTIAHDMQLTACDGQFGVKTGQGVRGHALIADGAARGMHGGWV